ncbi:glycoside hydrolase superfamily [Tirmania nivea]|nr:glycoside hydrolase superfamily [Tirmania nivea]
MAEAPQISSSLLGNPPQTNSVEETTAVATTGFAGSGTSFLSTTKGIIVLVLSGLAVLALILGLSLGLTVGRQNNNSCGLSNNSTGQDTDNGNTDGGTNVPDYSSNWKQPESLATSEGWFPAPRGGSDPAWVEAYQKAARLVGRMSLLEKVNVTTGTGWQMGPCVGNTGTTSVGFPSLCLQDGPLGIRFAYPITAFPAGITTAATFNKDLMHSRGRAMGREARNLGINALLGPCIGPLGRSPLGGRNWETFGSDPYLQGVAGQLTVRGIQELRVMAVVKHWLGNEQERFRRKAELGSWPKVKEALSANIGGRATREVYAWPFQDAVREGAAGVMCSYQQVNNSYACENSWLLNGLLKDELGFQGFVVSDWLAQRSGVNSVIAGMDMTMPGDGLSWADSLSLLGANLTSMVVNGTVPVSRLNDMALRIVASWYKLGQDSPKFLPKQKKPLFSSWLKDEIGPLYPRFDAQGQQMVVQNYFTDPRGQLGKDGNLSQIQIGDEDHATLARQVAAEGIVMLKNFNGTLPMSGGTIRKGPYKQIAIFGSDAAHNPLGPNGCVDRACNVGTLGQGWGSGSVEYAYIISPLEAIQARAIQDRTTVDFVLQDGGNLINSTARQVNKRGKDAACLVFVTSDSGEGYVSSEGNLGDRNDLKLWHDGDTVILSVADNCENTVVVIHSVGPVLMEAWADHPNVTAILMANLPGQESGSSLVDVLYGNVNPSGHLPYTIGKSLADYGAHAEIMWDPNWEVPQHDFTEGIYTDYKWFDKHNITPRYEFGYGMSYTSFNFSQLEITTLWNGELAEGLPSPTGLDVKNAEIKNSTLPKEKDLQFPKGWKRVSYFVYPYLPSPTTKPEKTTPMPTPYPYPPGYTNSSRNLTSTHSSSGGYQGGNPALWDPIFRVELLVTNTGKVAGKVAAQLYLTFPKDIEYDTPVRQLRGFEKVELAAGESKIVVFELTRRDISVWSEKKGAWIVPRDKGGVGVGRYGVFVGDSSRGKGVSGETEKIPRGN